MDSYRLFVMSSVGSWYEPPATKAIFLKPEAAYSGPIEEVKLFYYPQPSKKLSITVAPTSVIAKISHQSFDAMYHVLQTEDPVYMSWPHVDSDPPYTVPYIRLLTSDEPLGEGYEDLPFLTP